MGAPQLREHFLLQRLFEPGELNLVYTDLDRLVVGGVMPQTELALPAYREFGTTYFTERREIGILNLGAPGMVAVGGVEYELRRLDCLYIGTGEQDIRFRPGPEGPPSFYVCSSPAHRKYPTRKLARADANVTAIGDDLHACTRRIVKYICPGGIESCQLVMGFTELEPNSIWNTMPPHTHSRRSEIYLYFDLGDNIVFHFLGTPENTKHVVVHDLEAALSPGWSIHAGAGTANYRFAWAMAGENQDFGDVDPLRYSDLS